MVVSCYNDASLYHDEQLVRQTSPQLVSVHKYYVVDLDLWPQRKCSLVHCNADRDSCFRRPKVTIERNIKIQMPAS